MAFNNALDAVDRRLIRVPDVNNDYAMQIVNLLGKSLHPGLGMPCRVVRAPATDNAARPKRAPVTAAAAGWPPSGAEGVTDTSVPRDYQGRDRRMSSVNSKEH
ncbi:hypothetical protein [Streptomyces sp. NBC_01431]|uniref:hypothetical protein n=1 Tax=Streptomyces sp. NBC_01431 TaxID=2903863 RepID=UPI002E2F8E2D|nr:hypothetical protein [Streptomyces sp. NBC_01431]